MAGQMGVVSGTALDAVLARRLQLGDVGGNIRRAFEAFPIPDIAQRVWEKYYVEGGKAIGAAFKSKPMPSMKPGRALQELTILGNFVEVWLAKEGHNGLVGINFLEKIQVPHLPSIYGAMLAGVDYILMGAGIPRQIPGILNELAEMKPVRYAIDVADRVQGEEYFTEFDPKEYAPDGLNQLKRPNFLAIVSSSTLATALSRKSKTPVDGFVVELPTAGGHNAPPRGQMMLSETGEPIYGPKDEVDFAAIAELGLPFWIAGSYGKPGKLKEAQALGAQGIQVGTAFAYCDESGIAPEIKKQVIEMSRERKLRIYTDPLASPTGFPFKVALLDNTMSNNTLYKERTRICDLGFLRTPYRKEDGTIGYRCASEPVEDYLSKGGKVEDTEGRKCVCNGLLATVGMAQTRKGYTELPIVTSGDEAAAIADFCPEGKDGYSAKDVIEILLNAKPASSLVETVS